MARLIPDLSETQLERFQSKAEAVVYRAARASLGPQYLVLHGVEWILRHEEKDARDGETDFLICTQTGVLVIEIKGGGISFDAAADSWTSVDRSGRSHEIKDPFRQGRQAKFAVLAKLKEHPKWSELRVGRILIGHAVIFPDLQEVSAFCSPKSPREIVGSQLDLRRLGEWVDGALDFWRGQETSTHELGVRGMALIEEIFARSVEVRPFLSQRLVEEEQVRVRLTDQQAHVLTILGKRRRVAICGGAGTGKTMLAFEKARRLASEGFRTALLCYNRPLADFIASLRNGGSAPEVLDFHQLCSSYVQRAQAVSGRSLFAEAASAHPKADVYDVQWPLALAYATELLPDRFEAIVVDEGQDFREEYWLPIELLLADGDNSPLYVFFDQNQELYTRASSFPVRDEPFVLTKNCRNTSHIHHAAYRFFKGEETSPSELAGMAVESIIGTNSQTQAEKIHTLICRLLHDEKVKAADIVVLIGDARLKQSLSALLKQVPLPSGRRWAIQHHGLRDAILVETVLRYKGLEAAVAILWGIDTLREETDRELLYVGLSRAKSVLYLVGNHESCERILPKK
jgi:hypothetical protein